MNHPLPRRQFVQAAALAAAGFATLPAALAAEAPKKRGIKKAIMWGTVGVKGSILEKMKHVKAAGFAGVEPNGGMNREEVVAGMKETGLQAASVCCHTHWARPLSDPNPEFRKAGYDGLILSLKDAAAYGATSVLLVPGVVNDKVKYDDCFQRSVAEIKKAAVVAGDVGVKIAIENVWNNFITKPQQAIDFLTAIDSPHVGWHFDIGNVIRYSPPETWIPVIGKKILKLHVKEFAKKKSNKGFGVKLHDGDNDWAAIMKALDEVGYSGWGIAEQPGDQSHDLESFKDLGERMNKAFAS